jgi:hypothetical protein
MAVFPSVSRLTAVVTAGFDANHKVLSSEQALRPNSQQFPFSNLMEKHGPFETNFYKKI